MSVCLLCQKEIGHKEILYKLKRGTYSIYHAGFRDSGLEIHSRCIMKLLWDRDYPKLKLKDTTYEFLSKGTSIHHEIFWKIGTYKITKMTQENIERIETNHYKKLAKEMLSK